MAEIFYIILGMVVGYLIRWEDERIARLEKKVK